MPKGKEAQINDVIARLLVLSKKENLITVVETREFVRLTKWLFDTLMFKAGYNRRNTIRLTTKLRDAGRRSPPWKAVSSKVPGRPQDASDGNRSNRWALAPGHKFYADEKTATLVEVKYYFQALSMQNAPDIGNEKLKSSLIWLVGHKVEPGVYLDPIQLIPIDLKEIIKNLRLLHSGHLIPLDRGGHHEPKNAFLMYQKSNALQGNLTLAELLDLMRQILIRHDRLNRP